MPDEGNTPAEDIGHIRDLLVKAENALTKLHTAMYRAFQRHGHLLVDPDEVEPLAGGGTPKLPPPPGG